MFSFTNLPKKIIRLLLRNDRKRKRYERDGVKAQRHDDGARWERQPQPESETSHLISPLNSSVGGGSWYGKGGFSRQQHLHRKVVHKAMEQEGFLQLTLPSAHHSLRFLFMGSQSWEVPGTVRAFTREERRWRLSALSVMVHPGPVLTKGRWSLLSNGMNAKATPAYLMTSWPLLGGAILY